jgi:hypothetical protein
LLIAAWLLLGPARPAGADPGIALHILTPKAGEVTGSTTTLRVEADGADTGTTVLFTVAIDGQELGSQDTRPSPDGSDQFAVPAGGGQIRITLLRVSEGAHALDVRSASPSTPTVTGATVAFSVAPKVTNRPFNLPTFIAAIILIGGFLWYRQKFLLPRMRRFEKPEGDGPGGPSEPKD